MRLTPEGQTTNPRRFIVGLSVSPTPDAWQSAANLALVLTLLAACGASFAWAVLTCPEAGDASDDA